MKRIQVFVIAILSVSSCGFADPGEVCLPGYNNSDKDVWFSHYVPNLVNPSSEVNVYYDQRAWYYDTQFIKVEAGSAMGVFSSQTYCGWGWVKKHVYPNGLRIQVWRDDLIKNVGWDDFVENMGTKYKYEIEYVLDLADLEKIDYRITYPPEGELKKMVIYP